MRKPNKKIIDPAIVIGLLESCHVGRLGTIGPDGWPMVKPLNFAYHEGRIYFHSARQGEKLDDIRRDPRVCFEVDLPIAYVRGSRENPCRAEYLYRSVIVRGRARLVDDEAEQRVALDALMRKHQPDGGYGPYLEEKLELTAVVRIDIDGLSGKEDLGKDELREKALALLAGNEKLPVVLE